MKLTTIHAPAAIKRVPEAGEVYFILINHSKYLITKNQRPFETLHAICYQFLQIPSLIRQKYLRPNLPKSDEQKIFCGWLEAHEQASPGDARTLRTTSKTLKRTVILALFSRLEHDVFSQPYATNNAFKPNGNGCVTPEGTVCSQ